MSSQSSVRQLRFPYQPSDDESVCGAVAAACHEQRLRSVRSALEGAGISLPRPGSIQIAQDRILDAAAAMMRTEYAKLRALAFAAAGSRDKILVGGLIMPRKLYEWERRRIGPVTLRRRPHHRNAWLNLLLPFCPESLELLVDSCPSCGPLGWRHTRGIGNCDTCGAEIEESREAPLTPKYADEYRAFCALVSHSVQIREGAVKRFPASLREFSHSELVHVAMRSGIVFGSPAVGRRVSNLVKQAPLEIAKVLSTGIRLLTDWPRGIRQGADRRVAELKDDLPAFERFMRDVRWIGADAGDGSRALLQSAFPNLDGRNAHAFAKDVRYYTATETNTLLSSSSKQLKALRELDVLRYEKLPAQLRTRARYNADDVEALRARLQSSITPGYAAANLGLPVYAVDQLAAAGSLPVHDGPGVRVLRGEGQVDKTSVMKLHARIMSTADAPSSACAPLQRALAQFPGEKPWSAAIDAMLTGRLPFHRAGAKPLIRRMLVDPADVAELQGTGGRLGTSSLGLVHVSLSDACEVLGAGFDEGTAAIRSAGLQIFTIGKGKGVARAALLHLASEIAFAGEAASFTGCNALALFHRFTRAGGRRVHGAWKRADLVQLGAVSPFDYRVLAPAEVLLAEQLALVRRSFVRSMSP